MRRYRDRAQAGRALAAHLRRFAGRPGLLVLALPRGGVPVAAEVAAGLAAPLEVFVVRKLGAPGHDELAVGAIASGGFRVVNPEVRDYLHVDEAALARVTAREEAELARRERAYRGGRPAPPLADRVLIVVDDGLATGASMRAAVEALWSRRPAQIVVAVPVAPPETCQQLTAAGVEVLCPYRPARFGGVGRFYVDFTQVSDAEVREILDKSSR